MIPGLGNGAFRRLIDVFGSPRAVFEVGHSELVKVGRVREDIARRIALRQFSSDPEIEIKRAEKLDVRIIPFCDPSYPLLLKEIHSPPMILYVRGEKISKHQTYIAVVGSRNSTHYGLQAAENIGFGLARRGVGVVSGMAKGIDSAAHKGCLMGKGSTVAVIGTGIDLVYPPSNRILSERIAQRGTIVSEFPLGSPPEPKNFPIRNRVISGLCRGVVVVEATKKSGSLITASQALDQGREVFAVPGSIDSFKSTGAHLLIKQGAKLVENADDILDEIGITHCSKNENKLFSEMLEILPDLSEPEKKIYEILGNYPLHIDDIVRQGEMGVGEVSSLLMGLELKGLIRQLLGKRFVR